MPKKDASRSAHVRRLANGSVRAPEHSVTSSPPIKESDAWRYRDRVVRACVSHLAVGLRRPGPLFDTIVSVVWTDFVKATRRGKVHERGLPRWLDRVVPCVISKALPSENFEVRKSHDEIASIARADVTAPREDEHDLASFIDPQKQLLAADSRLEAAEDERELQELYAAAIQATLTPREAITLAASIDPAHRDLPDAQVASPLGITVERYRSYVSTAKRKLQQHFDEMLREHLQRHPEVIERLTPRESCALRARLEGQSQKEIAKALGLTEPQAESYVAAGRGKVMQHAVRRGARNP